MIVTVVVDGTDITSCVQSGSVTRRLNRMWQAQWRMMADCASGVAGDSVCIYVDATLWFSGRVMTRSIAADEDFGYVEYDALDALELWAHRPCRDYDSLTPGNFISPTFLKDKLYGPQIIESLMLASENATYIPEAAEGSLFLEYGTFEGGPNQAELKGAPADWPMSMLDMMSLLTSTGELDVVCSPVDSGGNIGRIDCYNGKYGNNHSSGAGGDSTVIFDFQTGGHNVKSIRYVEDMAAVTNKLQYFFTPRETDTRYKANITGDDPCLVGNLGLPDGVDGEGNIVPGPGGALPGRPNANEPNLLGHRREDSQSAYGVRMEIQEFDVKEISYDEGCGPNSNAVFSNCCTDLDPTRILFRRSWQQESWIRAIPRTLAHITPIRLSDNMVLPPGVSPVQLGDFDIGDLVSVNAGPLVAGGFSAVQRIYEYTVSWDEDGVVELGELQTSSDQEGAQ